MRLVFDEYLSGLGGVRPPTALPPVGDRYSTLRMAIPSPHRAGFLESAYDSRDPQFLRSLIDRLMATPAYLRDQAIMAGRQYGPQIATGAAMARAALPYARAGLAGMGVVPLVSGVRGILAGEDEPQALPARAYASPMPPATAYGMEGPGSYDARVGPQMELGGEPALAREAAEHGSLIHPQALTRQGLIQDTWNAFKAAHDQLPQNPEAYTAIVRGQTARLLQAGFTPDEVAALYTRIAPGRSGESVVWKPPTETARNMGLPY